MKNTFPAFFVLVLIGLSGFTSKSTNYEQLTLNYFVSEIAKNDFKDVTSFEFKGKTEETYSSLGKYKLCLKPEKLSSIITEAAKGKRQPKDMRNADVDRLSIVDFKLKTNNPRIFVYPSVHVADNYYVFLAVQKHKQTSVRYVFELTPGGNISRSCKLD
jgi:hypothetical protein